MSAIHTLDAVACSSDGSPFIYYGQSRMLSHAGRLYHQTHDGVLDQNDKYRAVLHVYVNTSDTNISINARRIYLLTYDCMVGFAYFNYVHSRAGTSDRIVYVMHAVKRLQRFWRSRRLMRKCEVLCMEALCTSRLHAPTWLQCVPVDILRLIQDEAMAFANY